MHCGTCAKKFSLMRTKKQCCECRRFYCKYCVQRKANKHINCENCAVLTSRPLNRAQLLKIKARDLQLYLANHQVSTKGCIEKEDLVNLLLAYASGADPQPPPPDDGRHSGRQLFQNIRSFFSSAPDISGNSRPPYHPHFPPTFHQEPEPYSTQSTPNTRSNHHAEVLDPVEEAIPVMNPDRHPVPPVTVPPTIEPTSVNSCPAPNESDWEMVYNTVTEPAPSAASGPTLDDELSDSSSEISVPSGESGVSNSDLTKSDRDFIRSTRNRHLELSDISTKEELAALTVKQLKELLVRNRVDFKGCVEKAELLERVSRLWGEHSQSREGLENLPMGDLCKICMDAPVECVMLECGHMATCTACGKQLSECPICRQYVVRVVRTFRA